MMALKQQSCNIYKRNDFRSLKKNNLFFKKVNLRGWDFILHVNPSKGINKEKTMLVNNALDFISG